MFVSSLLDILLVSDVQIYCFHDKIALLVLHLALFAQDSFCFFSVKLLGEMQ